MKKKGEGDFREVTAYERDQVEQIRQWKQEEPSVVSKALGFVIEPLAWLVKKVIPEAAVKGALDFGNAAARWFTDTEDIKRDAGVEHIEKLKWEDLRLSDRLADEVHNWAIGIGVVEGAGTGFFGLPGMAADVPAIITLALRTIHKIGVCYGYEASTEEDNKFALGILSASGANSIAEKEAALVFLRQIEVMMAKTTWKRMAEVAAREGGKEAAVLAVKNLAKQLGINLTKRKALQAIPAIGAMIGGSVNGWYIKDIG